ncbi:cobyrinate a,c-diamide synthase [Neisseria sp. Ec49-e6-T10]|uniref:cobyrinate a,c-diamide synthase n=1 Tax=Neisseria sp. Ec49-e6-T10 TaxID=3140744 RepID=UPI003EBBD798
MKKILFGATNSGAGKTTITLGIMHALTLRGLSVQPFKVGPDYLDTLWHAQAAKKPSCNLDAFMSSSQTLNFLFNKHAAHADISIIEGVMGLYDGYGTDPYFCGSAGLAKQLSCPVILVVDGKAVSTSIAATVMGFQKFDPNTPIAGVIVNRVNSDSHFELLKTAIEKYCGIPVIGRLPAITELMLPSRHLGLVPTSEMEQMDDYWQKLAHAVETYIDLDALLKISQTPDVTAQAPVLPVAKPYQGLKMAIAQDEAFNFYYQDNLDLLEELGITLVPFSPLKDSVLPDHHLIYIGGGFPEVFATELSQNKNMLTALLNAHQKGTPIYAECGGLMYLGQELIDEGGQKYEMVGILPGYSQMSKGLKRFGYCEAKAKEDTLLAAKGDVLKGHEFHHSEFITDYPTAFDLYKIRDGEVIKSWQGGYQLNNTLAAYLHIHFYQKPALLCHWLNRALQQSEEAKTEKE